MKKEKKQSKYKANVNQLSAQSIGEKIRQTAIREKQLGNTPLSSDYFINKMESIQEKLGVGIEYETEVSENNKLSPDEIPLAEFLKNKIPKKKCYVYKLTVGGEEYIGFTSQNPKKRLEQHIKDAKEGSKFKVHIMLRRFGYLNDFEVIGSYDNEVIALVSEISEIKKRNPTLNKSQGGEGNDFELCERFNELNEPVFYVTNKIQKQKNINSEKKIQINKKKKKEILLKTYNSNIDKWFKFKKDKERKFRIGFYQYLLDKFLYKVNYLRKNGFDEQYLVYYSTPKSYEKFSEFPFEKFQELNLAFSEIFDLIEDTNAIKKIVKEIKSFNEQILKIEENWYLENKNWEKNNQPSVLSNIEKFNRWLAGIHWETAYERKMGRGKEENLSNAIRKIRQIREEKSLLDNWHNWHRDRFRIYKL